MEIKKVKKSNPGFRDKYKGTKESSVKMILIDKDGKQITIKR